MQPFQICQIHLNPFLYLQPPWSPLLEAVPTELVRKAAAGLALANPHTCQKYLLHLFPPWTIFMLELPAY